MMTLFKARQGNVPYLLSLVGAVHNGCLVQCGINTGNAGQVDNHVVSGRFPQIHEDQDKWPYTGTHVPLNRFLACISHYTVDQTVVPGSGMHPGSREATTHDMKYGKNIIV